LLSTFRLLHCILNWLADRGTLDGGAPIGPDPAQGWPPRGSACGRQSPESRAGAHWMVAYRFFQRLRQGAPSRNCRSAGVMGAKTGVFLPKNRMRRAAPIILPG